MSTVSAEKRMPVLFIGHGNPMYGIEENEFTSGWRRSVEGIPVPSSIVVVSAHWETDGTKVTSSERPGIIHDFYGFPQALFDAGYDAPGSPELARRISELCPGEISLDGTRGLDHGAWTILRKMFPGGGIPVLQIGLDVRKTPSEHFEFAAKLKRLRDEGVLLIASGNIVHNLRYADFRNADAPDWARSADEKITSLVEAGGVKALADYGSLGEEVRLAVPTPEHYLPLLYAMAFSDDGDPLSVFNDRIDLASISMTSFRWG